MRCPRCGYESSDRLETCKRCGTPMAAGTRQQLLFEAEQTAPGGHARPGRAPRPAASGPGQAGAVQFDRETMEVGEDDLDSALSAAGGGAGDDGALYFRIEDDLFGDDGPGGLPGTERPPGSVDPAVERAPSTVPVSDLSLSALVQPDETQRLPVAVETIIDRDEEVPERYWAPEVAGIGRRAVALLVDQALLLATLGIFFLGAFLALRLNGFDTDLFLAAGGLQVSLLPFALLAAVLSLAYSSYFHRFRGSTPGKELLGIEVRTAAGGSLSWSRAILRWFGAAAGVACAGAGVCWALFEPRRRSWADLVSGTVVARRQRTHPRKDSRR